MRLNYKAKRFTPIAAITLFVVGGFAAPVTAGTTAYQYDALGRVIKAVYPDLKHICYAYDSAGNRTQVKRQATGTCTVTGSTLTSSLTAESLFAAQQNSELNLDGGAVTAVEGQISTNDATTVDTTSATDEPSANN